MAMGLKSFTKKVLEFVFVGKHEYTPCKCKSCEYENKHPELMVSPEVLEFNRRQIEIAKRHGKL
jgi:hypothetical protein